MIEGGLEAEPQNSGRGKSEHCTAEIPRSRRQTALARPQPGGDRHQEFQNYSFQTNSQELP